MRLLSQPIAIRLASIVHSFLTSEYNFESVASTFLNSAHGLNSYPFVFGVLYPALHIQEFNSFYGNSSIESIDRGITCEYFPIGPLCLDLRLDYLYTVYTVLQLRNIDEYRTWIRTQELHVPSKRIHFRNMQMLGQKSYKEVVSAILLSEFLRQSNNSNIISKMNIVHCHFVVPTCLQ